MLYFRINQTSFVTRSWVAMLFSIMVALASGGTFAKAGSSGKAHSENSAGKSFVLPASARPLGYSLSDMAKITAAFNVTDHSGVLPNTPFQILYTSTSNPTSSFRVMQGQFLYVPILYNDNSVPIIGDFPNNAENRTQLLNYWFSQKQFGTVITEIVIDGRVTVLNSDYLVGASFSTPLSDGATQYATAAVFIHPLPPGTHTIEFHFKATGDAIRKPPILDYFPDGFIEFRQSYTVTVY